MRRHKTQVLGQKLFDQKYTIEDIYYAQDMSISSEDTGDIHLQNERVRTYIDSSSQHVLNHLGTE